MDEKKYKEAVDDIKVDERLKNETLEKMKNNKSPRIYLKVLSAVAVVMLVFSVSYIGIKNFKKEETTEKNIAQISEDVMPRFKTKNELKEYLKERDDEDYNYIEESKSISDTITITGTAKNFYATDGIENTETSVGTNSNSDTRESSLGTDSETTDYSRTNNQVENVEEADIVKTDGKIIYYYSSGNKELLIIDSQSLKILDRIDSFKINKEQVSPIEIFLTDDKLVVLAEKWDRYYGYRTYLNTDSTTALVYDITDKENIELDRYVEIDGDYVSSRMIDNNLYFISRKDVLYYDDIKEREYIPYYTDTAFSKDEKEVSIENICYFPESEESNYINVVGVDVEKEEKANIETFIGASSDIYSSEDYLYLTKPNYDYSYNKYSGRSSYKTSTDIIKIRLNDSKVSFKAKGNVKGTILNQFSMDEYKGNFRIATTSYDRDGENENNIYILDEDLNEIGYLEGLAKDEKIYSVRFMGKTGYVVTFKQVDPLFVIDLSDPENPEVKGKLKIPGYSSYLHPYDDNHIIGIGKNTEETQYGSTVSTNMKMSMFDVSDLEDPKEMFSISIGGKGTTSEILDNHKALFFNKEKNLIGFPITIYDENYNSYYDRTRMQGAIIYEIDMDNKEFKERGTITTKKVSDGYYSYDYNRIIKRIIYIGDKIYAFSDSLMKVVNIDTLEEVNELEF